MKQIVSWIMAVALSMSLSSCFEEETLSPLLYKLSFTNGTDQTIIVRHNLNVMEEVITLDKGEEECFIVVDEYQAAGRQSILENVDQRAYIRVYREDGTLLKEWKKSEHYTIKNPFDYEYYDYSSLDASTDDYDQVSTFVIYGWLFVLE